MDINKRIRTVVVTMLICFVAAIGIFQPVNVAAATSDMTLSVKGTTALPGDTVQVQIYLENNPGLASLKFNVAYDEMLTLQKVEFSTAFGAYVTAPEPYKNPQSISFISPLTEVNANGIFATLTFLVSPNAPDQYDATVRLICDDENIFNGDYDNVATTAINGKVHIVHGYPGDINGDRAVNNKDAILLFQYVAGMDVKVDTDALDVNGDGKVNNRDAVILFRYVAGWDVEIGRGPATTVCQHEKTEILPGYPATCTTEGLTEGERCATCGEMLLAQEIIPLRAHEPEFVEARMPTCIDDGWTAGTRCIHCRRSVEGMERIPATGHFLEERVTTEPTCTEPGWIEIFCTVCFEAYAEKMPALGHEYDGSGYCIRCGELDPNMQSCDHDFVQRTEPQISCVEPAMFEMLCVICGYVQENWMAPSGHIHDSESNSCEICGVEASGICEHYYNGGYFMECTSYRGCTEPGVRTLTCESCWNYFYELVEPLGHQYWNGVCLECGVPEETVPTGPAFIVSNATAKAGDTIEVTVALKNNPGIAGAKITVTYSPELTLTNAVEGSALEVIDYTAPAALKSGCAFNWDSLMGEAEEDGVVLYLTFKVADNVSVGEVLEIVCSYVEGDIYDENIEDVSLDCINGSITIE